MNGFLESEPLCLKDLSWFLERLAGLRRWFVGRTFDDPVRDTRTLADPLPRVLEQFGVLSVSPSWLIGKLFDSRERLGRELPMSGAQRSGRLLAYFPDENLTDGAAPFASRGFFDDYNQPPRDTWVGYFRDHPQGGGRRYVVSFVPDTLVPLAQAGIDVNPEICIDWLGNQQIRLTALLREAGQAADVL